MAKNQKIEKKKEKVPEKIMSHDLSCSQEDLDEAVESKNRETFIDGELEW